MNKIVASIFLFLACISAGCKKDSTSNPVGSNTSVIGMNTPVVANAQNAKGATLKEGGRAAERKWGRDNGG